MTTYTFVGKFFLDVEALRLYLVAAGFPSAEVICKADNGAGSPCTVVSVATGDPTVAVNAYVDPGIITVLSNKPLGPDGVPETDGNGVDTFTITIQKKDSLGNNMTGTETINVQPKQLITISASSVDLVAGVGTVDVGPTTLQGELAVDFVDAAGVLLPTMIKLRFI